MCLKEQSSLLRPVVHIFKFDSIEFCLVNSYVLYIFYKKKRQIYDYTIMFWIVLENAILMPEIWYWMNARFSNLSITFIFHSIDLVCLSKWQQYEIWMKFMIIKTCWKLLKFRGMAFVRCSFSVPWTLFVICIKFVVFFFFSFSFFFFLFCGSSKDNRHCSLYKFIRVFRTSICPSSSHLKWMQFE